MKINGSDIILFEIGNMLMGIMIRVNVNDIY